MRRYLVAGLLVWIPLAITLFVVRMLMHWLDASLVLVPSRLRPENLFGFELPGLGLLLSFVIVLLTGVLAANYFGQRFIRWGESLLDRIPLVRSIYGAFKTMAETVLSDTSTAFRKAVLVEYPRKGVWQIGFLTGDPVGEVQDKTTEQMITVFVPTTPNPTSGWIALFPKKDVIMLDMSVEDAMKFVISLGVVAPQQRKAASGPFAQPPAMPAEDGTASRKAKPD
jgi:uncharacterized membrane protein